jgi:hypothetical protein
MPIDWNDEIFTISETTNNQVIHAITNRINKLEDTILLVAGFSIISCVVGVYAFAIYNRQDD